MPEDQAQGVTPEATGVPPVADADDEVDDPGTSLDAAGYKALMRKIRTEERNAIAAARAAEKERDALKKRLQEREDEELSESERLRKQVAELKAARDQEARERQTLADNQAIYEAAVEQHALKPAIIVRLIDRSGLQRDDSGKATNAARLVKDLLAAEPYLKGEGPAGVPGTPRSNAAPQSWDEQVQQNREKLRATGNYRPL